MEDPAIVDAAAPAAVPRRGRLITPTFLVVGIATLGYFTADGVILPAVPRYVQGELGGGSVSVGLVVGAFSLTALLLRPWAGRLADRRGRRLLMVTGAGVWALSVLGYVVSTTVPVMIVMRLLSGAGEAFFFTGAASAISDLAPEDRRGEATSFFSLALYLGIAVGPVIGESAIGGIGFSAAWVIAGGICLGAALLSLRVPDTRPEPDPGQPTGSARLIHPAGVLPGIVLLANVWGMAGFFAFVPLYALDIGLSGARLVFVVFSVIVMAIRLFGARIPDVLGPGLSARLALLGEAAGLTVIGLWRTPTGLFTGTAVLALGIALAFPALMTMAIRRAPAWERGAVLGTFTAFLDLAFGIGPVSLGFVVAGIGFGGMFLTAAGVAAVGLAVLLVSRAKD